MKNESSYQRKQEDKVTFAEITYLWVRYSLMKAEEFLHSTGLAFRTGIHQPHKNQDKISEVRKGYQDQMYGLSEWQSACEVP